MGEVLQRRQRSTLVFGQRTSRALEVLGRAAMPAGERLPAPGPAAVRSVEAFLSSAPWPLRLGYRLGLLFVSAGALLSMGRPLSRLDPQQAARLVERWARGRGFLRRAILRAVLTPLKVAHYATPEVSAVVGYDPPPPVAPEPAPRWWTQVRAAEDHAGEVIDTDVVVVGSGPGGAVMATRLAEVGLAVVILEEGRYLRRSDFTRRPFEMTRRLYRDGGMTVALGVPGIPVPVGRTVGGTSTINSGTCYRVPEHILERWRREHHLEHLDMATLGPHYADVEAFLEVQPVPVAVRGKVAEVIARGCDALGYAHGPLRRNAAGCEGSGVCCFGCPTGAKRSMDVSFVPRALRAGARLFTGARVETLLHAGGRVRGVVAATEGGGALTVRAETVVLACGAFGTPVLLMRNRLGRTSPALGEHLTLHPAAKCGAIFEEPIRSWEGVPQSHTIEHFHDEGLLFEGASVPPDYGAMALAQVGEAHTALMERYAHLAFFGFLIEDSGAGSVRPGPDGSYWIRYTCTPEDVARLKRGTRILADVFFAAGARKVLSPIAGLEELSDPKETVRLELAKVSAARFELSAFHPLGTCRMAVAPELGVVDPGLECWDLDGLFVADGSVFPSSLVVNPQMTIMALVSACAGHVAERAGGGPRWR